MSCRIIETLFYYLGTEMPRAPSDELSPVAVDSLTNYMTMTAIYVAEDGYAGYRELGIQ